MAKIDPLAGAGRDLFTEESGPGVPRRTRRAMRDLDYLLGLGGGPSVVTGQSPLEGLSLTGLENQAQGIVSGEGATSQQFALGRNTTADVLNQAGPAFENYFQQSVQNPLLQMFGEKVIPQLDTELARSGFFGTARERSLGGATDRLMRALTESKAGLFKDLLGLRGELGATATAQAGAERESDVATLLKTLGAGDTQRQKELQRISLLFGLGNMAMGANQPLQQFDLAQAEANNAADMQFQQAMLDLLIGKRSGGAAGAA